MEATINIEMAEEDELFQATWLWINKYITCFERIAQYNGRMDYLKRGILFCPNQEFLNKEESTKAFEFEIFGSQLSEWEYLGKT